MKHVTVGESCRLFKHCVFSRFQIQTKAQEAGRMGNINVSCRTEIWGADREQREQRSIYTLRGVMNNKRKVW